MTLTDEQIMYAKASREARAQAKAAAREPRRKVEFEQSINSVLTGTAAALEQAAARAQGAGLFQQEQALMGAARDLREITSGALDITRVQAVIAALDEARVVAEFTRVGRDVTAGNVARCLNDLDVLVGGGKVAARQYKWTTYQEDMHSARIWGEVKAARKLRSSILRFVAKAGLPQQLGVELHALIGARLKTGRVEPRDLKSAVLDYAHRWIAEYNRIVAQTEAKRYHAPLLGDAPRVDHLLRPIESAPAIPTDSSEQTIRLPLFTVGEDTWTVEQ